MKDFKLSSSSNKNELLFIVDKRDNKKDIIYFLIGEKDKLFNSNNIMDGFIIFYNIYNNKNNLSKSYFSFGKNKFTIRFFPEYLMTIITKYFYKYSVVKS